MSSQMVRPSARAEVDHRAPLAGLEVALLVEDAVVGQQLLAVDRLHLAAGHYREGVVDVLGALGGADQGDDALGLGARVDASRARAQEVLLEQQVLGRVAGDASSGEHELRAPSRARAIHS